MQARAVGNVGDRKRQGRVLPRSLQGKAALPTSWFQTSASRRRENKGRGVRPPVRGAWFRQLRDVRAPCWAEPHPPLSHPEVLFPPLPLPSAPIARPPAPLSPGSCRDVWGEQNATVRAGSAGG